MYRLVKTDRNVDKYLADKKVECEVPIFRTIPRFIATSFCNAFFLFTGELITRLARFEFENEGGKFGNLISALFLAFNDFSVREDK